MTNRPTLMHFYQIYLCWFYNLEDVTEKLQGANLNVGLKWHLLYGGSMMTIDDLSVTRLLSALFVHFTFIPIVGNISDVPT